MDEVVKKYGLDYFETDENLKGFAQRYTDIQYSGKYNMFMQVAEVLKAMGIPTEKAAKDAYYTFIFNYADIMKDLGLYK